MKSINIEMLMGHSIGISDSYYRVTEQELLDDYLKAVDYLTISNENSLKKEIVLIAEQSKINCEKARFEMEVRERDIRLLTEKNNSNSDAIAALSDQVMYLVDEIDTLKRKRIMNR